MKRFIEVAEYDNSWPTRFEAEASKLSRVFQHNVVGIQKDRLAAKFTHNNIAYMKGKNSLVKGLIERAMKWKAQQC
jgi:GrpB-like predicted nucleotidyltransferase (UPF0157 family)